MTEGSVNQNQQATTGVALQKLVRLCQQYEQLLDKIIQIKNKNPETESFARTASGTRVTSLQTLKEIAQTLLQQAYSLNQQLEQRQKNIYAEDSRDDPYLNHLLLNNLAEAINKAEILYAGQAGQFAIMLNELVRLSHEFHSHLTVSEVPLEQSNLRVQAHQLDLPEDDEMMIYVRVFHRQLPKLGLEPEGLRCIPILLEMVKYCEKNGLAVYEELEWAEQSLRNDSYAFFSACIKRSQNLTAHSPVKRDPYLHCILLTVQKVEALQLRQFKHREQWYWVEKDKLVEVNH